MQQKRNYTTTALLLVLIIAILANLPGCYERKEKSAPVPECRFEGAECPNVEKFRRDYQIEVINDTITVYDVDRIVSRYITRWDSPLDSVIIEDNR